MASPKSSAFFNGLRPTENFELVKSLVENFVKQHLDSGNRVVLITSGGTTVPLESRTVRFIDNFSIGTRGALSAEYFLKQGYAVIFLHRLKSLLPFHHRVHKNILDVLTVDESNGTTIKVQDPFVTSLAPIVQQYQQFKTRGMLCQVDFTTLEEYLLLLRASCQAMQPLGQTALIYLAAAVSDFYIPNAQLPEHKIQSSDGRLQLSLEMTPKMLKPLVKEWVPKAYIISFKLETDSALLIPKARGALHTYEHQMVIANLLHTRKRELFLVWPDSEERLVLSDEDFSLGKEIEEPLIARIADIHTDALRS